MQRAITLKNALGNNSEKNNLLIILYQLSKYESPGCYNYCDINFSMSKFLKGNNSTKKYFFSFSPGNLLIILYWSS